MSAPDDVFARLAAMRIVPVVEVEHARDALPLARTLVEAGLPVVELTFRTEAALDALSAISAGCPEILLGAGTLLDAEMVRAARAGGAQFGVSPGLQLSAVRSATDVGLPFIPGVVTPSEILTALEAGARHLKFFPAGTFGGVSALSALAGPLAHTGVTFMPTGGIRPENAAQYLALSSVFAVGGTWIAPRGDITAGRWADIAARATAAADLVRSLATVVR